MESKSPGDRMSLAPSAIVVSLFSWLLASSMWIYPHSISYFNESIGGPHNGPKHLLGSNVDWGQDVRYLTAWSGRHGTDHEDEVFHVGAVGCLAPDVLGIKAVKTSSLAAGDFYKVENGVLVYYRHLTNTVLNPGEYLVSVNYLYSHSIPESTEVGTGAYHPVERIATVPYGSCGYTHLVFRTDTP